MNNKMYYHTDYKLIQIPEDVSSIKIPLLYYMYMYMHCLRDWLLKPNIDKIKPIV